MSKSSVENPNYGNWVSMRLIWGPGLVGLIFIGLTIISPWFFILAIPFLLISLYFIYARYMFSPQGGNVQEQVRGLVLSHLDWNGKGQALDIGCGSGALTIALAKKYPEAQVTGIDYWGEQWEYSKKVCERNAEIEGVTEQVIFQKASASALPFADGSFDLAVSNLTFHEVNDTKDKRQLLCEALRVVKHGGKFVFQDLFLWEAIYGKPEQLVELIKSWGIRNVEFIKTCDAPFIPSLLKLPFMIGKIGILCGEK